MVRLKDIAALAHVSVMTVSKSLHDAPDISAGTKARIRLLAEQMGYVPNSMAQSLRSRTTRLYGLVVSAVTNPLYSRLVLALEERLHEQACDLLVAHNLKQIEREEQIIRRFLTRRVDGLFISPVYRLAPQSAVYEELVRRGTKVIVLGHPVPFTQAFAHVTTDDQQASYLATRHLLDLGHRRIAFLAGPNSTPWAQERLEGYRRALREAQVEWDDRLVYAAGSRIEDGEKAAAQLLAEAVRFTAVQGVNDMVAIGAGNLLLQQGWQVPQQVSLIGFGDVLLAENWRIPLTTVQQPKYRLGVAAMEMMVELQRGNHPPNRLLPASLVLRASTAVPAA